MKLDKSKTWLFRVETEEDGAAIFKHLDCPVNWVVCRLGVARGLVWNSRDQCIRHTPSEESLEKGVWVDVEKLKESLPREPVVVEGMLVGWEQSGDRLKLTTCTSQRLSFESGLRCGPVRITIEEV